MDGGKRCMKLPDAKHSERVASVPKQLATCRLDHVARDLFPEYSRSVLSRWIREGRLTLGNERVAPKHRVREGDQLRLIADQSHVSSDVASQAMDLCILYEDEALIIVEKPAGLVVHPGAGNTDGTLMNGLLHYRPELRKLPRAGLVHRLDADTSGLMLIAATAAAYAKLVEDIAARRVKRQYQAIAEGVMVSGAELGQPIGRHPRRRTIQVVRGDGRSALTSVRVLERYRAHSLVRAQLHTGRTHQIRVHLSHAGFPLVGDRKYGARGVLPKSPREELVAAIRACDRQMLHAVKLGFVHPRDGSEREFSSRWPDDMQRLVELLRNDAV